MLLPVHVSNLRGKMCRCHTTQWSPSQLITSYKGIAIASISSTKRTSTRRVDVHYQDWCCRIVPCYYPAIHEESTACSLVYCGAPFRHSNFMLPVLDIQNIIVYTTYTFEGTVVVHKT